MPEGSVSLGFLVLWGPRTCRDAPHHPVLWLVIKTTSRPFPCQPSASGATQLMTPTRGGVEHPPRMLPVQASCSPPEQGTMTSSLPKVPLDLKGRIDPNLGMLYTRQGQVDATVLRWSPQVHSKSLPPASPVLT